jgi:hypothetical protein
VNVVALRKIASLKNNSLKRGMCSACSRMDATDCHEVLRGPLLGLVPIVVRYRASFSTALVSQLHFSHLYGQVSVESACDLYLRAPSMLRFLSHGDAAPIAGTQTLDDVRHVE